MNTQQLAFHYKTKQKFSKLKEIHIGKSANQIRTVLGLVLWKTPRTGSH